MLLGHYPENAARRGGEGSAFIFEGQHTSFVAFDEQIRRLSSALVDLLPQGSRVALLSDNRTELTVAQVAVPTAGMIAVFINQRLIGAEIAYILADSAAAAVIVERKYLAVIASIRDQLPLLRTVICMDGGGSDATYQDLVASGIQGVKRPTLAASDPAWLVYTSGTTGRPKGAMLSHRSLTGSVSSFLLAVAPKRADRFLLSFPLSHVAAYLQLAFLAAGVTSVLQRSFDVEDVLGAMVEHEISGTFLAPAMIGMIVDHPGAANVRLDGMRTVIYGASSMANATLRRAMQLFANAEFIQGFGMTESGGSVVWMDHDTHREGVTNDPLLLSACGRPSPLASIRVVDEQGNDVPVGEPGEILVRADQVMEGYWGNPEATRDTFADGWLHTGDVGRQDVSGLLHIVDRKKDMIVTGGENVYSREVENALAELPEVADVAVIGVPDDLWGESVCAVVVPAAGCRPTADQIIAHCRQRLAAYKKPKFVHFVDALPRNATGKVLKQELRTRYEQFNSVV